MIAVVARSSRLAAAARAWMQPLPVLTIPSCIGFTVAIALHRHAVPASPQQVLANVMSCVMLCWTAGGAVGFTWKQQVCRPQARVMPRYRATHAVVGATTLMVVVAPALAATIATGIAASVAVALTVLSTALGALGFFSRVVGLVVPPLLPLGGVLVYRGVVVDALASDRCDIAIAALTLTGVAIAWLAHRVIAIDEDDALCYVGLRPPSADARRQGLVWRLIRRGDRHAAAPARATPLAASTVAWAVHRARLFRGMSGLAKMGAISFGLGTLVFSHQPLGIASIVVLLAPTWVLLFFMSPAFAQARAHETLRPASRRRDIASMLLGLSLAQARDVALVAGPVAACIALRAPEQLAGVAFAAAIAAASAPMISAVGLALSTARSDRRRQAAIFTLFAIMGMILSATSEQIAGGRSGWILAAAAIADLVVIPLAWRRLIRIDIE